MTNHDFATKQKNYLSLIIKAFKQENMEKPCFVKRRTVPYFHDFEFTIELMRRAKNVALKMKLERKNN